VAVCRAWPSASDMDISAIRQSFAIILANEPGLTSRFYDLLFARHPRAARLFSPEARVRQARMLAEALVALVDHLEDAAWLGETLPALGRRHASYGVTDEMYDWVGECLLAAMAQAAGPAWTPEVERAWAEAYQAVAGLMMSGARDAAA
jgi:hemoglobin-like flavoprotein